MKFTAIFLAGACAALLASASALAAKPAFNCSKAATTVEKAICGDENLAALDRETSRLYKLASADKTAAAPARSNLKAMQRGWIKGRNDCWKADDLEACVTASYVTRIQELRLDFPGARRNSGDSTSTGPFVMHCPGISAPIQTAFVQVGAGYAWAGLPDHPLVLTQVVAASGAHYELGTDAGVYSLWNKGAEVLLQQPGQPDAQCTISSGT